MALQSTTALATITLQAATSEVTFSGIPNIYRDLVLTISGTASGDHSFAVYFNGDSTSGNYSFINAGDFGSYSGSGSEGGEFGSSQSINVIEIFDYSQTNKHKTFFYRRNNTARVGMGSTRWANTNAINSVKIQIGTGTISAGTNISLYGRIA